MSGMDRRRPVRGARPRRPRWRARLLRLDGGRRPVEAGRAQGVPARPPAARPAAPVRKRGLEPLLRSIPPLSLAAPVPETVLGQQGRPPARTALPRVPGRRQEGGAELGQIGGPGGAHPGGRAADLLRQGRAGADAWPLHTTTPAREGAPDLGRRGLPAGRQLARRPGVRRSGMPGRPQDRRLCPQPAVHGLRRRRAAHTGPRRLGRAGGDAELAAGRRRRLSYLGAMLWASGSHREAVRDAGGDRRYRHGPRGDGARRRGPRLAGARPAADQPDLRAARPELQPLLRAVHVRRARSVASGRAAAAHPLGERRRVRGAVHPRSAAARAAAAGPGGRAGDHHAGGVRGPRLPGLLHQRRGRALSEQLPVHDQRRRHGPDPHRR